MIFKTKTLSYDTRARTFWILALILGTCLIVYVWAIRATISNTIARASLESSTANLSAKVGEMEFNFISLANNVSLQLAYDRGFQNVNSPIYISRSASHSLSMNR